MTHDAAGIVLFLPLSKGNFLEMLPLAKEFQAGGMYQPVFCLESKQMTLCSLVRSEGLLAVRPDGSPCDPPPPAPSSPPSDDPERTRPLSLRERVFSLLPSFIQALLTLGAAKRRIRRLCMRYPTIRLVMVAGDRNVGHETALIAVANQHHIPSLIVPFAMSFPEAAAEPRLRRGTFAEKYGVTTVPRRILRFFFPAWVRVHKGIPMFFHPPFTALAAWVLGMMPRSPWQIGGGQATTMAVESEAIRNMLIEQGMQSEKMVVTGKPGLDEMAKEFAAAAKQTSTSQERIILCSVPQLAEHDLLTWDRHRDEMQFLFDTMAASGARVLLSLHPKSDRAWYQPLADAAGVEIASERIYELLPACDVLVATYSSTVAQAIALGKPCVVVDFYDLQYPVYDTAPGVSVLRDRQQFPPLLQRLLNDRDFYDACVHAERESGSDWAILDGKNTERVIALAEELIGDRKQNE